MYQYIICIKSHNFNVIFKSVLLVKVQTMTNILKDNFKLNKTRETRSVRRELQVFDKKLNIRVSLQGSKSISDNKEKLYGLLYSYENYKFEFRSLLGLISVLDNLECATLLPFQEAHEIYSSFFEQICIPG